MELTKSQEDKLEKIDNIQALEPEWCIEEKPLNMWHGEHLPGLVGEISQRVLETSYRPNPILSTAAGLTTVSMVCGRHIIGPTGKACNLNVVMVAPTGGGKDDYLKAPKRILQACGYNDMIGSSGVMSYSALVQELKNQAAVLMTIDEIGSFISNILSDKAGTHERKIAPFLRTLFDAGLESVETSGYASIDKIRLIAPHLSIHGATTARQFFGDLTSKSIQDGTVNRFTVFWQNEAEEFVLNKNLAAPYTDSIIRQLKRIYEMSTPGAQMMALTRHNSEYDPVASDGYTKLDWADDQAAIFFENCEKAADVSRRNDELNAELMVRKNNIAIRIAQIIAVGCGERTVSVENLIWGMRVAETCQQWLIKGVKENIAESKNQADCNKVLEAIRKRRGGATRRDIHQGLRKTLSSQEVGQVLATLVEAGDITAQLSENNIQTFTLN